jgi:hypothetical protein
MNWLQRLKGFLNREVLGKPVEEPFSLDYPDARPKTDTIGLFNNATILRVERELTSEFNYNYHENEETQILADKLTVVTDKGSFHVKSCNNCDVLYFRQGTEEQHWERRRQ